MDTPVDPYELFGRWFTDAEETEPRVPNAVAVATADAQGRPSVRQVLLKAWDERGFVFYTNLGSRKGRELAENPWAALNFHWKTRMRQVQVRGRVEQVSDEQADAYQDPGPRVTHRRLGEQAEPTRGPGRVREAIAKYTARYAAGEVPRPEFWSGFRVVPDVIEFWEDKQFRLHLRFAYERTEDGWRIVELYP